MSIITYDAQVVIKSLNYEIGKRNAMIEVEQDAVEAICGKEGYNWFNHIRTLELHKMYVELLKWKKKVCENNIDSKFKMWIEKDGEIIIEPYIVEKTILNSIEEFTIMIEKAE
jgi:hypothetical protein